MKYTILKYLNLTVVPIAFIIYVVHDFYRASKNIFRNNWITIKQDIASNNRYYDKKREEHETI